MKSKLSVILQKVSMAISVVGYLACVLPQEDIKIWPSVFLVLFIGSCIWHVVNTICPHCGRVGLKPKPFAPNAGTCLHCNQQVDYK